MGFLSIFINLLTVLVVSLIFYITFLAYNKRQDRNETWFDSFIKTWSSLEKKEEEPTQQVAEEDFEGQDWSDGPCEESLFGAGLPSVLIDEPQDDVSEFMDSSKPNFVGTGVK